MKAKIFAFVWILVLGSQSFSETFKISQFGEITSYSTLDLKAASGGYVLAQLNSSLLEYHNGRLEPRTGQCTILTNKTIRCEIGPRWHFSNGVDIRAEHFLKTYQEFLNPKHPALRADLLLDLQNAQEILKGEKNPETLGFQIDAKNPKVFTLKLIHSAHEFIYNLANPLLAPVYQPLERPISALKMVSSGAYKVSSVEPGRSLTLEPQDGFHRFDGGSVNTTHRILVKLVNEDNVALAMYKKGELDLLRRIPSLYLSQFKKRFDFHNFPQERFDYFVYGPRLKNRLDLRKILSESLDFEELGEYFQSPPRPGCPGLRESLYTPKICLDYKIKEPLPRLQSGLESPLVIAFSKAANEDVERTAIWMQDQWKKKIRVDSTIKELETKVYAKEMINNPADVFRRGYAPDRPTCLSFAENFNLNYDENPIPWLKEKLQPFLQELIKASDDVSKSTRACHNLIQYLLSNYLLIPTGPMEFSMLVNPHWSRIDLNELYILDLSRLSYVKDLKGSDL